jgi:hypothetical protein
MRTFEAGDFVLYRSDDHRGSPSFMMWHGIEADGKPSLVWHPYRWSPSDHAVVLESKLVGNNGYVKVLKCGGGVGWILAAWCKR